MTVTPIKISAAGKISETLYKQQPSAKINFNQLEHKQDQFNYKSTLELNVIDIIFKGETIYSDVTTHLTKKILGLKVK